MADLTINGVSDDVVRELERQAADAGLSLNDYLVACLTLIAHQPTSHDGPVRHDHSDDDHSETQATLSDEDAMRDIAEADAAYDRGDVVRGDEAIRELRPHDRD